jgi:hypothetical protein
MMLLIQWYQLMNYNSIFLFNTFEGLLISELFHVKNWLLDLQFFCHKQIQTTQARIITFTCFLFYFIQINACNGFYCDAFAPNKPYKPTMWTEAWSGWYLFLPFIFCYITLQLKYHLHDL